MTGKFLIDECLSVALVGLAKARGIHADHVSHLGKSGWQDWNLVAFALANDYLLVTNNRRDFLVEYAKVDIHSGLIVIVPNVEGSEQRRLFEKACDAVVESDPVNKLVEVLGDASVHVREWTRLDHDSGHISSPDWS